MKKIIHLVSFALAIGVIATGIITAASTNKQLQVSGPVETTQTHAGTESKTGWTSLAASTPKPTTSKADQGYTPNKTEVEMLAKLIWGEARGIKSTTEKAAVAWCVLNRVDSEEWPNTVEEVITQPHQFAGYSEDFPATEENKKIAADVLMRYNAEKNGDTDAGRVLPEEYTYFTGDGTRNCFRSEYIAAGYWGWNLKTPYKS